MFLTYRSAATKDDSTDGNTFGIFPLGMNNRALTSRASEAGIGMGCLSRLPNSPVLSKPGGNGNVLKVAKTK